jgi:hypothetical protein
MIEELLILAYSCHSNDQDKRPLIRLMINSLIIFIFDYLKMVFLIFFCIAE